MSDRIYVYLLVSKSVKAQELASSHLKTSILDVCKHVTALIENNAEQSVNFNQECFNIILAIISILLH